MSSSGRSINTTSKSSPLFLPPSKAPPLPSNTVNSSTVSSPPVSDSPPSSSSVSPPPSNLTLPSSPSNASAPPLSPQLTTSSPPPPPPPPPQKPPPPPLQPPPRSSPPPGESAPPAPYPFTSPPISSHYSPPPSSSQPASSPPPPPPPLEVPSPSQPVSPPLPPPPPPSVPSPVGPLVPVFSSPPPHTILLVPPPPIEQTSPASLFSPTAASSTTSTSSTTNSTSSSSGSTSPTTTSGGLVPPSSHASTRTPSSPSASNSSSSQGVESNTSPSSSSQRTTIVGVAVAGVFIFALIATVFVLARKKKRKADVYPAQYVPPPNFTVQSDGYYYGQKVGVPGQSESFYVSQIPHTGNGNSFGSQRGNIYPGGGPDSELLGGSKSFYSYEEVMEMTSGFAHQNVIGEGGFGSVYKGQLPDGRVVAVKQLKAGSGQGDREFRAEVDIISRVHHRHLVSLVGYCIHENQRMLIYEFLPNKTLDYHLHGEDLPVLDWEKRVKIALGSAKGLAYLHEDCHPKIIHRDIKSSNILLDDAFDAQVSDFGLAKLTNDTNTHVSTRVMGTFGYLAPEYASSGKLTDRSDVFSFGVVLLELITGRKPVDPTQPIGDESLVEWARPLLIQALETGDLSELVDPRLQKHYVESEMIRMIEAAAACIRHSATKRPRMAQVVRALDSEGEMSDLTNGVRYGQSTIYDSGQYSEDIMKFRRMALGSNDSSDHGFSGGDYTSREVPSSQLTLWKSRDSSSEFTGSESETRAMNPANSHRRF